MTEKMIKELHALQIKTNEYNKKLDVSLILTILFGGGSILALCGFLTYQLFGLTDFVHNATITRSQQMQVMSIQHQQMSQDIADLKEALKKSQTKRR